MVPLAPGGGTDAIARMLAQEMAKDLGVTRHHREQGAAPAPSSEPRRSSTSEPDGYTLLMGTFASAVNSSLVAKLPYDARRDLAPVALVARAFNIVVVNPQSPLQIDRRFDRGGEGRARKTCRSAPMAPAPRRILAGNCSRALPAINMTAVPYKGSAPAITDLLGGQIQVMFTTVSSAAALIEGGQLRALAVTSAERSPAFPQLPTVAEAGVPGYVLENWYGLFAPAKTPPEIIDRLNRAAGKALQSEAFRKIAENEGLVMVPAPPQEFARYFRGEEERWRKVIQDTGIKADQSRASTPEAIVVPALLLDLDIGGPGDLGPPRNIGCQNFCELLA